MNFNNASKMQIFRQVLKTLSMLVFVSVVVLLYNNCSSNHAEKANTSLNGIKGIWTCNDNLDDISLFSLTYHPFLMNNCVSCHAGQGPGPGAFANTGVQIAIDSFNALGFTRINTKALDGHSPYSGPQNAPDIQDLTLKYVSGLDTIEECANNGSNEIQENQDDPARFRTVSKAIGASATTNNPITIDWNLDTQIIPNTGYVPSNFTGMRLRATVQKYDKGGILAYVISNPRILTTNGDVHIESLLFKINGVATPAQRAFYLLKKDIRAWNTSHPDFNKPEPNPNLIPNYPDYQYKAELISGGSMISVGEMRTTDVISVSIGVLQRVTLPPPNLGPQVSFGSTSMTIQEGFQILDIPVNLSAPSNDIVYAEVYYDAATSIKDGCCRATVNDVGAPIQVEHFDRDIQDYDLDPGLKINRRINFNAPGTPGRFLLEFRSGDVTKNLRIKIIGDDRDEPNEQLILKIDPSKLTNSVPGTANQTFTLTINDDDAPNAGSARTYFQLLNDGGILANECLRCHNSVLKRGGYDITHWEMMVNSGILKPGDPANSLMFLRMDANLPGLQPMPLTGLIDPLLRQDVKDWILQGAPNN